MVLLKLNLVFCQRIGKDGRKDHRQHLTATECGITAFIYNLRVTATVHIGLDHIVFTPVARLALTGGFLSSTK